MLPRETSRRSGALSTIWFALSFSSSLDRISRTEPSRGFLSALSPSLLLRREVLFMLCAYHRKRRTSGELRTPPRLTSLRPTLHTTPGSFSILLSLSGHGYKIDDMFPQRFIHPDHHYNSDLSPYNLVGRVRAKLSCMVYEELEAGAVFTYFRVSRLVLIRLGWCSLRWAS